MIEGLALIGTLAGGWVWGYVYGVMPLDWRLPYWLVTVVVVGAAAVTGWLERR